jgi:hypothetical protein
VVPFAAPRTITVLAEVRGITDVRPATAREG